MNITTTKLVFFLIRFHALSLRLLLSPWRLYSLQQFPTAAARCACIPWYECEDSRSLARSRGEFRPNPLKRSASIDIIRVTWFDRDGGEQTALKKKTVSLRDVYVWSVDSAVTTHSRKKTSERVTRFLSTGVVTVWRCDDTSWQEAIELLCIKTLFLVREYSNKKIVNKPRKYLSDALLMSRFQNVANSAKK